MSHFIKEGTKATKTKKVTESERTCEKTLLSKEENKIRGMKETEHD